MSNTTSRVEHQKRAPDCHFFTLIDEAAKSSKSTTKSKKGRTSRASKASRLSTQSNVTLASDIGLVMDLDEIAAEEEDVNMSMMSTASKVGGKGRTKKAPAKTTKKSTRKAREESILEPTVEFIADGELMPETEELLEQSVVSVKPKTTRGRTTRKQDDSTLLQVEPSQVDETVKPERGRKRASDGTERIHQSVIVEEVVDSRPLRGRKAKVDTTLVEASQIAQSIVEQVQDNAPATKHARQTKKQRAAQESSVLEPQVPMPRSANASPAPSTLPKSRAHKATKASKLQIEETLAEDNVEYFPAQAPSLAETAHPAPTTVSSPQPEASAEIEKTDVAEDAAEAIIEDAQPHRQSSPAAQSSNAENEPPASSPFYAEPTPRPAKAMTPRLTPQPTPGQVFAARTPTASPSRAAITTTALMTAYPWSPINLSTIFLASPTKASSSAEALPLKDVIARLSEEEREMSIEAWIMRNASKAEDKLRGECERMIGAFEGKGAQAVRSLGGVVVA
jgi:hypothetical protein